jgi:hypothetical protein
LIPNSEAKSHQILEGIRARKQGFLLLLSNPKAELNILRNQEKLKNFLGRTVRDIERQVQGVPDLQEIFLLNF